MRRGVGVLVLAVVVVGAVWCVDGCPDPTDKKGPIPSSGTYTCVICVVPFATVPRFSLPDQQLQVRTLAEIAAVHFWIGPTQSIDHPPRFL